mgnify:CR=1 FL=1
MTAQKEANMESFLLKAKCKALEFQAEFGEKAPEALKLMEEDALKDLEKEFFSRFPLFSTDPSLYKESDIPLLGDPLIKALALFLYARASHSLSLKLIPDRLRD